MSHKIIEEEIWKFIPETNNLFKISNQGRVIKVPHIIKYVDGRDKHIMIEKELKLYVDTCGYKCTTSKLLKKIGGGRLHYILYKTFIDDIPKGYVVDHIDENKLNNDLNNLQVIKNCENARKSHNNIAGCYFRKDRNKWSAIIAIDGKRNYLGVFITKEEATKAYSEALQKLNKKEYA